MDDVLDGSLFGPGQPCFGCAPDHPFGLRLRFERRDGEVITRWTGGEHHQGPPGIVHGGLVMALADEIGAWSVIALLGKFGFTAQVQGKLQKALRTGQEAIGRGRILKDSGRLIDVAVSIEQAEAVAFSAELRFVVLDEKGAERLLGGPVPDAWKRFGR